MMTDSEKIQYMVDNLSWDYLDVDMKVVFWQYERQYEGFPKSSTDYANAEEDCDPLQQNAFLVICYDYAVESKISPQEAFDMLCLKAKKDFRQEVEMSGWCRTTKWNVLHKERPCEQLAEYLRLSKSIRRGVMKSSKVPLRMINTVRSRNLFEGDFIGLVMFSALCSLYDRRIGSFGVSDVWKVLHQSNRWNSENDKKGFEEMVFSNVERLNRIAMNEEDVSGFVFGLDGEGNIIVKKRPRIWEEAEKDILLIHNQTLHVRCRLHWLQRIYIARRIELSRRYHNMTTLINLHTMQKDTGMAVDTKKVEGYMKKLVGCNMIEMFDLNDGGLYWKNTQKPSEPRKGSDHIDDSKDGESGSESK